ncbi:hypothetical protein CAPTEDRAFT_156952, partial [Capitella teleta]
MLAKVETQEVNDAVSEFVRRINETSEFWIGLTRANDQSEWRWMDDTSSSIVWSKWENGEPTTGEKCARLRLKAGSESRWYGIACDYQYSYVCERGLVTTPPPPSSPTGAANASPAQTGEGNTDKGSDSIARGPTKKLVKNDQSNSTPIEPSCK